ncbi:hypothetical protein I302_109200 [Kwoniella bestiolae CBS 10118]|uniref:Asl1-like glycosyl hydrolase catalytic domain-containing protein n=1 Tax=Kwoniella bestiolae CBS 10118 TaxID=1296100 RepID=A0A1B9FVA5_9TREE|nr:hypothetical protein I302_08346 [Kwoniella bestiolae CBS 10118]OCF22695.1 hypothetical protein I302_08346 [Kwoniella bestiolae CBS 10118]
MQLSTLLPILALLATSTPALASTHRRHSAKAVDHARAVERLATAMERRQPMSEGLKPKRKVVRKRGTTCKARTTSSSAAEEAATTTSQAAAAATETSAAWIEPAENYTNGTTTSQVEAASSATSTSAAAAASTSAASSSSSNGQYTPNGIKAGIAGGDAYDDCESHIGWWYDWSANPSGHSGTPIAVPMLWGAGTVDSTDSSRLDVFKAITSAPQYIMGFEEPDCSTWGSANIDVSTAAGLWNTLIGPFKAKGSTLISPSMCHQAAEQYIGWLGSFEKQISVPWDITNIHVNKNNMDGVKADIDYYYNTFGKPIWVTEFACVDDSSSFIPCTDQSEINTYINDIVALFEADERVHAYAYSNGDGLGDVWPMYSNGALSQSGQTYISAISKYH